MIELRFRKYVLGFPHLAAIVNLFCFGDMARWQADKGIFSMDEKSIRTVLLPMFVTMKTHIIIGKGSDSVRTGIYTW